MKRSIFYLLMFTLFSIITSATTINDDVIQYCSFDDSDTIGDTAVCTGLLAINLSDGDSVTTGTSCIVDECYTYDGGNDRMKGDNFLYDWSGADGWTIIAWSKYTGASATWKGVWNNREGSGQSANNFMSMGKPDSSVNSEQTYGEFKLASGGGTLNGNVDIVGNGWMMWSYRRNGNNVSLLINGTVVAFDNEATHDEGDSGNEFIVGSWGFANQPWIGDIDEVLVYNRSLNISEIQDIYTKNLASDGYPFDLSEPSPPNTTVTNTSFIVGYFNLSDTTFGTDTYFNAHTVEFNVSATMNVSFLTSFNTLKVTPPPQVNQVFGKVFVDGNEQKEELLRTVSDVSEAGSSGFTPITTQLTSGTHNITFQFRRTNGGNIQINDFDLVILQHYSSDSSVIPSQLLTSSTTNSNTDFTDIYNFTGYLFNESLLLSKITLKSSTTSNVKYKLSNYNDDLNSSTSFRYLSDTNDIGTISLGHSFSSQLDQDFTVLALTDTGTITSNFSILHTDYEDVSNRTIQNFISRNTSSDDNNNLSISAGSNLINSYNHELKSGDTVTLYSSVSFKSTSGTQTPTLIVNSSDLGLTCFSKKERYLSDNNDIGHAYLFTVCSNLTANTSYLFQQYVEVPTGENLDILDENLLGFDSTSLNLISIPPDFSIDVLTNLSNNTLNFNDNNLLIPYNFTVGNDNLFNQANCSLIVNEVSYTTQVDRNLSTNYVFNYTVPSVESVYNFSISCTSPDTTGVTGIYRYHIDTILPVLDIDSDFMNGSILNQGNSFTLSVNFSDGNLFSYNVTILDSNNVVWNNEEYFAENLTTTFASNITTRTLTDIGNFTILLQAWDSHTCDNRTKKPCKVRKLNWETLDNFLLFEDMVIEGDIKAYKDDIPSTYFWLSEDESKYKFKLTFNTNSYFHYFNLSSNNNLYYIETSEYKLNFVNFMNKRWLDFESDNIKDYQVTKIGEDKYEIGIETYTLTDEIEFSSLGDLNYNSIGYSYSVRSEDTALLRTINTNIGLIYEVIRMIPLMMLYTSFLFLGYWLIRTGNALYGGVIYVLTTFFDFYLMGYYGNYALGLLDGSNGFLQFGYLMLGLFMIGLVFVKISSVFLIKQTVKRTF